MRRYRISEKVGRRIRQTRRIKELTQEEVAYRARIHLTTLGRIERGEINSPIQTLSKIAAALGVKPREIMP